MPLFLSWDWNTLCLMTRLYPLCMHCACFCSFLECPRKWWFLVIFGAWLFNFRLIAEYQDIVDFRDILAVYVEEKLPDYEIRGIPGDGLCVLRSFKVYMEAATGQSIPLEDIKQKLKEEMCLDYYSMFLRNVGINNGVEKFLLDPPRCYDSEICHVFQLALGNTYIVNVRIYQANVKECWLTDLSNPSNDFQLSLYFARSLSNHLDPIVKKKITRATCWGKKYFDL